MTDKRMSIRPYREQDWPSAMQLADRLQIGVATWRSPDAVREAVRAWVRGALDGADAEHRAVIIAWMPPDSSA